MKDYTNKDYYGILNISFDADSEEIKKAFRKAVIKFHPDVNKNCEKIFLEIKEAYEVLSDENERKVYDFVKGYDIIRLQKEKIHNFENTYNYTQNDYQSSKFNGFKYDFSEKYNKNIQYKTEKQETFNKKSKEKINFEKTFSDLFGKLFVKNNHCKQDFQKTQPQNGSDITMPVEISYKEAINGTNRKINVLHTELCPVCEGKNFVNGYKCKYCNGIGEISIHKKLNVKIPPLSTNNKKIRIIGEGTKGLKGGKNGNLYIIVRITDDSYFRFEGNNVFSEIEITPYEAALGCEKEVRTINGTIKLKIPKGTSSSQKFRLANEGLFDEIKKIKGHQIVTIKIKISENLSERERQLYEELKNINISKGNQGK